MMDDGTSSVVKADTFVNILVGTPIFYPGYLSVYELFS